MTVRLIVRVASYAEMNERGGEHLHDFRTVDVESPELEALLKLDYGNRAHATVIGAVLLKPTGGVDVHGEGHVTRADCWCEPEVDSVHPDTGATVYVHREKQ